MPLSQPTLAAELRNLKPAKLEPTAISNLSTAFTNYFAGATVGGVPAVVLTLAPAKAAMQAALVGMSVPGAAPGKIQAGITAFWGVIAATAAAVWPGTAPPTVSATPPPGLAGIAAAIVAAGAANVAVKDIGAAAQALAAAIHPTQLGGIAITPPGTLPIL